MDPETMSPVTLDTAITNLRTFISATMDSAATNFASINLATMDLTTMDTRNWTLQK